MHLCNACNDMHSCTVSVALIQPFGGLCPGFVRTVTYSVHCNLFEKRIDESGVHQHLDHCVCVHYICVRYLSRIFVFVYIIFLFKIGYICVGDRVGGDLVHSSHQ